MLTVLRPTPPRPVIQVPVRRDLRIMHVRLKNAFTNTLVMKKVIEDLTITFEALGIPSEIAAQTIRYATETISDGASLTDAERKVREYLRQRFPHLQSRLVNGLSGRADLIASQLAGRITPGARIADIGCGDAKVDDRILNGFDPAYLIGYDVVDYRAPGVKINFHRTDGFTIPLYPPDTSHSFDYVLLTNVLHHAELNGWLINQAHRLLKPGGKALVHETVPDPVNDLIPLERLRVFVLDYFYNRIFHDADIPVPGTYETIGGWVDRFSNGGLFKCVDERRLGVDQELIRDYHVFYEFEALPL